MLTDRISLRSPWLAAATALSLSLLAATTWAGGALPPAVGPPEQTLVLEGTPPVPAELTHRLGRYLDTRSAWLADLAPDGRGMLVSTRFGEMAQIHHVTQPLGMRRQVTFRDEPVGRAMFVPGQPGAIVFSGDIGGNEQHQWFRKEVGTGDVSLLTDGTSRHEELLWSRDGGRVAFSSNARNGKDFDVYVAPADALDQAQIVGQADGHWLPLAWSPDDQWLLGQHYVSTTDRRIVLMRADGTEQRALTDPRTPRAWRTAAWHPDGKRLYVVVDQGGEFTGLHLVPLGRGPIADRGWVALTEDIPWDVDEALLSTDGVTLAFTVNAEGWSQLWLLDVASGVKRRVEEVPDGIVARLQWARDARVLGFTRTGPTSTGDVWTLDVGTGSLTRWTESELGRIGPETLVEPELVRFESFDGLSVPAWVYRPTGAGPHPVIIDVHGGPESQARPWFSSSVQSRVAAGFAVVVPNVRGSSGYGRTYVSLDNGMKREDSVKDIGALLDWIADAPELDGSRVGITGGSYGGYMVLASLVHFGDRLKAGVDMVGISNFVTFLENTREYRQDLRRVEYGDEQDPAMRAFLERISPSNRADQIRSALFVAHGANDPRVPLSEATQIVEAARAAGNDVWSMVAWDEGHGFSKKHNRDTFAALQLLFFETHLQAGPPAR